MDFAAAWNAFDLGDPVAVANGQIAPRKTGSLAWRIWRSHNFTGEMVEKIDDGGGRAMQIRVVDAELAPNAAGNAVIYTIREGAGHGFAAAGGGDQA